jgi:hypothetical protein
LFLFLFVCFVCCFRPSFFPHYFIFGNLAGWWLYTVCCMPVTWNRIQLFSFLLLSKQFSWKLID